MRSTVIAHRWSLALRWARMLGGKSYWHLKQDVGKHFVPGELLGYYNDLSGKTQWEGPVDTEGLPLTSISGGEPFYFSTTLIQKALGHWDNWLGSKRQDTKHYEAFLKLADWALNDQDEHGGWKNPPSLREPRYASPYSAITQGEGVSMLVRAFSVSEGEAYLKGAQRALTTLLRSVEEKGTRRWVPEGLVLEEYPLQPPNTVLNGWIFGLYGLYDYLLVERSREIQEALEDGLSALIAYLPRYDAGFWSFYDTSGNLASPFYHRLHIAQLKALELTFPQHAVALRQARTTFERQSVSRRNLTRAVLLKTYQKLRHPQEVVLR